jgi:hypothetical protein
LSWPRDASRGYKPDGGTGILPVRLAMCTGRMPVPREGYGSIQR